MVVLLEDVENRGSDDTDKNPEAEGEMGLYMNLSVKLLWKVLG